MSPQGQLTFQLAYQTSVTIFEGLLSGLTQRVQHIWALLEETPSLLAIIAPGPHIRAFTHTLAGFS